ncbi:hypothetical protein FISHEDRAFT_78397 [Fistulina hepatica ATCC 64428]|nr:hypothetical protein FISHEDRAFT_78397 [Fistulina hepatica ATCC 64428]
MSTLPNGDNIRDLNTGGAEALQALLNSIAPQDAQDPPRLTSAAVERLAQKIEEIAGPDAKPSPDVRESDLLNEEGLPIVEITEQTSTATPSGPVVSRATADLLPVSAPPDDEETKRRTQEQLDRLFDRLEEEERVELLESARREEQEREESLRKRREAVKSELEALKASKDMYKKMGKGLLRDSSLKASESDSKIPSSLSTQPEPAAFSTPPAPSSALASPENKTSTAKKSVSFADDTKAAATLSKQEWGDVKPGRLRAPARQTVLSREQAARWPMKMQVVERLPRGQPIASAQPGVEADSDDESEPEAAPALSAGSSDTDVDADQKGSEAIESDDSSEGEYDMDFVHQQREIALEYYEKRATFGRDTFADLQEQHSNNAEEHDVEVNPSFLHHPKSAVSRFKADQMAKAFNLGDTPTSHTSVASPSARPSVSQPQHVDPDAPTRILRDAIRTGKLDDYGNLVGGEDASASEDEEESARKFMELLKRGEVYNMGPAGVYTVPPPTSQTSATPSSVDTAAASAQAGPSKLHPPLNRSKTSRFKASLPPARNSMSQQEGQRSSSQTPLRTPVTTTGRSSPKESAESSDVTTLRPASVDARPAMSTSVVERRNPRAPLPVSNNGMFTQPGPTAQSHGATSSSTIVESPSFPSSVVESPSFPSSTVEHPSFPSMVVESPSFPSSRSRRLERPPRVVPSTTGDDSAAPVQKKRVSKFKAERSGP